MANRNKKAAAKEVALNIKLKSDPVTFDSYYNEYLNSYKNFYASGNKVNELGNMQSFWFSTLELIKMTFIKNEVIRNIDLNGFIKFNFRIPNEFHMIKQAKGVAAGKNHTEEWFSKSPDVKIEDLKEARGTTGHLLPDAYIASTGTIIEQKANRLRLDQLLPADDTKNRIHIISAYHQALWYCCYFPEDKVPKRIVTSNFEEIWVYEDLWQKNVVKVPVKGIENYWDVLLPILYEGGNKDEEGFKP